MMRTIIIPNVRRACLSLLMGAVFVAGCSAGPADERSVVASFYSLAFAAERVAGPGTGVIDLTPPGGEAHDVELSFEQRSAIENADVVLYLGEIGFQPQVESSVQDTSGTVVDLTEGMELLEGHAHEEEEEHAEEEGEEALDPHVWLDPVLFQDLVERIAEGLGEADPDRSQDYGERAEALREELAALDRAYEQALADCETTEMIVSHEAFGYLAERYGLEQHGIAGLEPEGEPTAAALQEAADLLRSEGARAVFYEASAEAERIARSVAADAGVEALPLHTLESRPPQGDYLSVMEDNLASLREGLVCR